MPVLKNLRIGIDIDGVLADFTSSYIRELDRLNNTITDIGPKDIKEWHFERQHWPQEVVEQFWNTVAREGYFWRGLDRLTENDPYYVSDLIERHDVYFVSKRPLTVKAATEAWMYDHYGWGQRLPTVVLSNHKGHVAYGLELDIMFDDKPANLQDIMHHSPKTDLYLISQPWNQTFEHPYIHRVTTIKEGMQQFYAG
jgi:5'(3')-deoxyribonucleotidase